MSLIEVMIASLFITIGFFGYVALHSRILHSGRQLEEKEQGRSATNFLDTWEVARIRLGLSLSYEGIPYPESIEVPGHRSATLNVTGRDLTVMQEYYGPYIEGIDEVFDTGASMYALPYRYTWEER